MGLLGYDHFIGIPTTKGINWTPTEGGMVISPSPSTEAWLSGEAGEAGLEDFHGTK